MPFFLTVGTTKAGAGFIEVFYQQEFTLFGCRLIPFLKILINCNVTIRSLKIPQQMKNVSTL